MISCNNHPVSNQVNFTANVKLLLKDKQGNALKEIPVRDKEAVLYANKRPGGDINHLSKTTLSREEYGIQKSILSYFLPVGVASIDIFSCGNNGKKGITIAGDQYCFTNRVGCKVKQPRMWE